MAVKLENDIAAKLSDLLKRVPNIVADAVKAMPYKFGDYVGLHMGVENRNPAYPHSNASLFVKSGALLRAVSVPGSPGYGTKVKKEKGVYKLVVGIDEDVIPYAMIHEYGGTIEHPGGTPYMIVEGGKAVFLKKGDDRAIGKTKPHDIKIEARPYIAPAMKEFSEDGAGLQGVFDYITDELNRIL